jgi:DNA-binding ferritin-like protein
LPRASTRSPNASAIAAAEAANNQATADLDTRRVDVHQTNVWMLSSHLE